MQLRRVSAASLAAAVVFAAHPGAGARADTIEMIGGFFIWSDRSSWNNLDGPDQPPGVGDIAVFNLGGPGYNFFLDLDATCDELRFETNSSTWLGLGAAAPHTLELLQEATISGDLLQIQSIDLVVNGDLTVNGDATLFASGATVTVDNNLQLGLGVPIGAGSVTMSGSTMLDVVGGALIGGANGNGTLTVQGSASANVGSLSVPTSGVGVSTTGAVNVTNGATLATGFVFVATVADNGATGQINVSGLGSALNAGTELFTVGAASGTTGTVVVEDDGTLSRPAHSTTLINRTGSVSMLSGGTLDLGDSLTIDGGVLSTVGGGDLNIESAGSATPELRIEGFGLLDLGGSFAFGTVASPESQWRVNVFDASEARVEADWRIAAEAGTRGLTHVRDVQGDGSRSRLLGTAAAGDLVVGDAGAGTLLVTTGGLVDEFDNVIVGNLAASEGTLTVEGTGGLGTASSLSAQGNLYVGGGPGAGTAGASGTVVVQDGGDVSATEVILAAQPGSSAELTLGDLTPAGAAGIGFATVDASGSVNIGGDGQTAGGEAQVSVGANGTIDAGSNIRVWPGSTVTLEGGTIVAGNSIGFGPVICDSTQDDGGVLTGYGILVPGIANSVVCCGRLTPGALIEIDGDFTNWGVLEIELGGMNPGVDYDQVIVAGVARAGGVVEVSLTGGFMPPPGSFYDVLVAQSLDADVFGPPQIIVPPPLEAEVLADRIRVTSPTCPWDCDGSDDGQVTTVDFFALISEWGMIGTPCDFGLGAPGVDIVDFFELIARWGLCP
ncbi:MAG: autotransporter outer membrane beta-barrel domain-containing protein [Planctomycetota bacterium]|jgi:hypothetical protein